MMMATSSIKQALSLSYLSSILGELKVNHWDHIGIIVPQKVKGYLPYYEVISTFAIA